jgi:hypothetical protein
MPAHHAALIRTVITVLVGAKTPMTAARICGKVETLLHTNIRLASVVNVLCRSPDITTVIRRAARGVYSAG